MTNSNLEKGIQWHFDPDWPGQRCRAKTRGLDLSDACKAVHRALRVYGGFIY